MPIYTTLDNPARPRVAEDFPAGLFESTAARFFGSFAIAPLSSGIQTIRRELTRRPFGDFSNLAKTGMTELMFTSPVSAKQVEMIGHIEANELTKDLDLHFDGALPRAEFDLIVADKKKEIAREIMRRRAPNTLTAKTIGIGAEFFAQIVDPINLASAFIPIVGEARWFLWANRFGVTRARVLRGSIEGFVGNALVEPIVAVNAAQVQSDYTAINSLMNLAFGTAIGGGLHVSVGRARDIVRKGTPLELDVPKGVKKGDTSKPVTNQERVEAMSMSEREAVGRVAVMDLVEGRKVDVEPVFRKATPEDIQRRLDEGADVQDLVDEGLLTPDEARTLMFEERALPSKTPAKKVSPSKEPRIEVDTAFRRGPDGEELIDFVEGQRGLTPDEIRDRDFELLALAQEERSRVIDRVISREIDPKEKRLANSEAFERSEKLFEEHTDPTKLEVVQSRLAEEELLLASAMVEIKKTKQGDEILELLDIQVREDGSLTPTDAIKQVDKDIKQADLMAKAIRASEICIRGGG